MKNLSLLLSPRIRGIRNTFIKTGGRGRKRLAVVMLAGLVFWGLLFLLSTRVLTYFQSVEVIGDLLARHLLGMVLLTFFSLLVFSHVVTSLSNLYLSSDLGLCHASPASLIEIFLSRVISTILDSSWMVIIFGLPVVMAYAYVYRPGAGFYVTLAHMGLATGLTAAGLGILLTMVLVRIFPAQRTRDIVMLLSIVMTVMLYLLFRFLRPERLVDPEAFLSVMQYVSALSAADSPYLPTYWLTESLWFHLTASPDENRLFTAALAWSTALAVLVINLWTAEGIYFSGFSKAQEAKQRRGGKALLDFAVRMVRIPFKEDLAGVAEKEVRVFFRDNAQWSQLLLLAALVVVYVYNFSVLPLERSPLPLDFLQHEIAFLNVGLAGFVLCAISVRFIFPSVSSEGGAFWILRCSPLALRRFLWGKFALYVPPVLILGEILVVTTNRLLNVSPVMMVLSVTTMFVMVFGIVALGVGFGALYANFTFQNVGQISTGFGGLMFMICSALYVAVTIALEAGPVYLITISNLKGVALSGVEWLFVAASFLAVGGITASVVRQPMKMGLKALQNLG